MIALSGEQLHWLLEKVERDGYLRIVVEQQDEKGGLIVAIGGKQYQINVNGEEEGKKESYVTEDGVTLQTGDAAYDYYNMKPGKIGRDHGSGWFDFEHTDGTSDMLNGQRICSVAFARRRGFKTAEQRTC